MVVDKKDDNTLRDIYLAVHATRESLPVIVQRVETISETIDELKEGHRINDKILILLEERYVNLIKEFLSLKEEKKKKEELEVQERKQKIANDEQAARNRRTAFITLGVGQTITIILFIWSHWK